MSLSNLESQLASINNLRYASSKSTGSALVGRGHGFSSIHGHALSGNDASSKPSILMSPREAADVPIVSLATNCADALSNLSELTGNETFNALKAKLVNNDVQTERRHLTKLQNEELDENLFHLLNLISTCCDPGSNTSVHALHVLEFLIRRYEIHARRNTASVLISRMLPYHEAPFFLKILQLIDLADVAASVFLFLRPYVVHNKDASSSVPKVERRLLAKQVAKDDSLLRLFLDLAKNAARVHALEVIHSTSGEELLSSPKLRDGIARIFSFVAAVVVESFDSQVTSNNGSSLREETVRSVLPYISSSCDNVVDKGTIFQVISRVSDENECSIDDGHVLGEACFEYRLFGYLLSAALAESCVLTPKVKEVLTGIIIKGSIAMDKRFESESSGDTMEALETCTDSILTVINILLRGRRDKHDEESFSALELAEESVGCVVPRKTLLLLCRHRLFIPTISHLSSDNSNDVDLFRFLAAFTASCVKNLSCKLEGKRSGANMIEALAKEPSVLRFWSGKSGLSLPLFQFIIRKFINNEFTESVVENYHTVVAAIMTVDASGCDSTIANILSEISKDKILMERLGLLLHLPGNLPSKDDFSSLLPSRIGLESADSSIRLSAVDKVMKEVREDPEKGIGDRKNKGDSLAKALMRRIIVDDDIDVSLASCKAFRQLSCEFDRFDKPTPKDLNRALRKWSIFNLGYKGSTQEELLCELLELCTSIKSSDYDYGRSWKSLVIVVLSHIYEIKPDLCSTVPQGTNTNKISLLSAKVLSHLLGRSQKDDIRKEIELLCLTSSFTSVIDFIHASHDIMLAIERRASFLALASCSSALKKTPKLLSDETIQRSMAIGLKLAETYNDKKSTPNLSCGENEASEMLECLGILCTTASKYLHSVEDFVTKLTCVKSSFIFEKVCRPSILTIGENLNTAPIPFFMGIAYRSSDRRAISRIMDIVSKKVVADSNLTLGLLYSLVMVGSDKEIVRLGALSYVREIYNNHKSIPKGPILDLYGFLMENYQTDLEMDGRSALPRFLLDAKKQLKSFTSLVSILLQQCRDHALGYSHEDTVFPTETSCSAIISMFAAMELAGEEAFPLLDIWNGAAKDMFEAFSFEKGSMIISKREQFLGGGSALMLIDRIVKIMKGAKSNGATSVSFLSGPSNMYRSRSYSLGTDESLFLNPYPSSMVTALIKCLSTEFVDDSVQNSVLQLVVGSPSWITHVYSQLNVDTKCLILKHLVRIRLKSPSNDYIDQILMQLPSSSSELVQLVHSVRNMDLSRSKWLLAFTIIADCMRSRVSSSRAKENNSELFEQMFIHLSEMSSKEMSDVGGVEYSRVCILKALHATAETFPIEFQETKSSRRKSKKRPEKSVCKFSNFADLLVKLLGSDSSSIQPLVSARAKELTISLLALICTKSPKTVVPSLMSAISRIIHLTASMNFEELDDDALSFREKVTKESLFALVPVFCENAGLSGLSFRDLLMMILKESNELGNNQNQLKFFVFLSSAFESMKVGGAEACASLVTSILANECYLTKSLPQRERNESPEYNEKLPHEEVALESLLVLDNIVLIILNVLDYASKICHFIANKDTVDVNQLSKKSFSLSFNDLVAIAKHGPRESAVLSVGDADTSLSAMLTVTDLISLLVESLKTSAALRVIKGRTKTNTLGLQLWQHLMQFHADILDFSSNDELDVVTMKFWNQLFRTTQECLNQVQSILPIPHFLASVLSLLKEKDGHVGLQRRALRLLGERVTYIEQLPSSEGTLFLDVIPDLIALLNEKGMDEKRDFSLKKRRRSMVLHQAVLVAVEQIAGHLFGNRDRDMLTEESSVLVPCLKSICVCMTENLKHIEDISNASDADAIRHLLSTSSLTLATLLSIVKMRALPILGELVEILLSSLKPANAYFKNTSNYSEESRAVMEVLQKAVLRAFIIIVDSLPQFLGPHLESMLSPVALLSCSLRVPSMSSLSQRFDKIISRNVPGRLLLPTVGRIAKKCLESGSDLCGEARVSLQIMAECIANASSNDISSMLIDSLDVILVCFGFEGDGRFGLLEDATKTLLSIVMKISEAQLRPLFSRLREWRGDIVKEIEGETKTSSIRRYAFWSMTAVLCRELRSLFLPCMSSVVGDIVEELNFSLRKLHEPKQRNKDGSKRRRVSRDIIEGSDLEDLRPLQPLLLALELALKADAHSGGEWIRANDSQRYQEISQPLCKLFLCRVPSSFPLNSENDGFKFSAYEKLVQGRSTLDHGNVHGCINALAAAAGNEQLWKPLNHAILNACSHDSRAEVRRAGINTLFSILQTLGEEYMILLPECLPVLSELLEDENEDVARVAKECVQFGEDLLGETLQL